MTESGQLNVISIAESPIPAAGTREERRAQRSDEILSASIQLFAEGGYSGFSMRKVAATAGVRLNTVQHYFKDLNTLLFATIAAIMDGYVQRYRSLAEDTELPARTRLEAMLEDSLSETRRPEVCRAFMEVWTLANHDAAVADLVRQTYRDYCGTLSDLVKGVEPKLSDSEAKIIGTMLAAWTEGMTVLSQFGGANMPALSAVIVTMKTSAFSLLKR